MLIEEIMKKDVVTLSPSNTVKDALEIMLENKIRHLPIITEDRTVVGIITDRDLKEIVPSTMSDMSDKNVYDIKLSEVMTKNPITAHPMDFVEESAVVFYKNQIWSLPVSYKQLTLPTFA
jgi:acetoin utilization protein AcuB